MTHLLYLLLALITALGVLLVISHDNDKRVYALFGNSLIYAGELYDRTSNVILKIRGFIDHM